MFVGVIGEGDLMPRTVTFTKYLFQEVPFYISLFISIKCISDILKVAASFFLNASEAIRFFKRCLSILAYKTTFMDNSRGVAVLICSNKIKQELDCYHLFQHELFVSQSSLLHVV